MQPLNQTYTLDPKIQHIIYSPQPIKDPPGYYHPILAYPTCPLIGRYNKGEYRIGEIVLHLEFSCRFMKEEGIYACGDRPLNVPELLVHHLRNIPQVIPYNKPKGMKNQPDVHLIHHIPQPTLTLNFILSFGQIGKDFLNYLNHTYIFDQTVFYNQKLNRTTYNMPILVHLPKGSSICEQEVQRGICYTHFRSQYMSIHLKGGAPAFSPNNMRLGVEGMKKVNSGWNNQSKGNKGHNQKKKGKTQNKQKVLQNKNEQTVQKDNENNKEPKNKDMEKKEQQQVSGDCDIDWQQLELQIQQQQKNKTEPQPQKVPHKFVHFYTATLLQNDHRINYHWHIEDPTMQDSVKQILAASQSIQQFANLYKEIGGNDHLIHELAKLLLI